MPDAPLENTTAIVTGASRGFGRATAVALSAAGAHVVGVARDADALDDLRRELGPSFTAVVADLTDPAIAPRLVADHGPGVLVLNAGATPMSAPLQDQTWEGFSRAWTTDVNHVFHFVREALRAPLVPGSTVVSLSSGAARAGSPLSGGYAGAKATIGFTSAYARGESERLGLGIRFVSVLPKLTPATALGSTFVDSYADHAGTTREAYLAGLGPVLTADQVGASIVALVTAGAPEASDDAASFLLTADGLSPIP